MESKQRKCFLRMSGGTLPNNTKRSKEESFKG
jgi:hypothetical protein